MSHVSFVIMRTVAAELQIMVSDNEQTKESDYYVAERNGH